MTSDALYLDRDLTRLLSACVGRKLLQIEVQRDADAQDWVVLHLDAGLTVRIAVADRETPIGAHECGMASTRVH